MLTVTLHSIHIFLSLIAAAGIYVSYMRSGYKNRRFLDFAIFFFILAFYEIFLTAFAFTEDLTIVAWFYNLSVIPFFIMLHLALQIPSFHLGFTPEVKKRLKIILTAVAVFAFTIQVYDFRPSILHESGFIFWNGNLLAVLMMNLSGFMVAMTWVYSFSKSFTFQLGWSAKIKTTLIIISAFVTGVASLSAFHLSYLATLVTFIALYIGGLAVILMLLVPSEDKR